MAIDGWIHCQDMMMTMMAMACVTAYVFIVEIPGKDLYDLSSLYIIRSRQYYLCTYIFITSVFTRNHRVKFEHLFWICYYEMKSCDMITPINYTVMITPLQIHWQIRKSVPARDYMALLREISCSIVYKPPRHSGRQLKANRNNKRKQG